MLERIENKDVYVRNYTNNFDIKDYIHNVLMPIAFPDIEIAKLNLGYAGITSEMISNAIEDSYATASLMMNEAFITKAVLPNSIYSNASLFNLGYSFASPSRCSFAVQLWIDDIINYSTEVYNSTIKKYIIDKNTSIPLDGKYYTFDYDVIIDHQMINGERIYNIYYDIDDSNGISEITNQFINYQVSSIGWLVIFVKLGEYSRKTEEHRLTNNISTANSDVFIKWSGQIAGLDLIYTTPSGDSVNMMLKQQYTSLEKDAFVWYKFYDDNTIQLMFSSSTGYFSPAFNSTITSTVYTCNGESSNFDNYDNKTGLNVYKLSDRYSYNALTKMTALCYGESKGGVDKGGLEDLRNDVITAYNTSSVITTDNDLRLWFDKYAKRYGTISEFFKRRDDPSGKLFSQFIAITEDSYIYSTNTLDITVHQTQFDFVNSGVDGNNEEFIINPGHLWEYDDNGDNISRTKVRMVMNGDVPAKITDTVLPTVGINRPFMFTNPFYIKIHKYPMISANYNYLINHTSWPENIPVENPMLYNFQLATLSINRTLIDDEYTISVICVPVVTDTAMTYVISVDEDHDKSLNNLRMLLITRTSEHGETGYIEMTPVEFRTSGAILFEAKLFVYDNIGSDMLIYIDQEKTYDMKSLIRTGTNVDNICIDAYDTSFHFAVLFKDLDDTNSAAVYDDPDLDGYIMTNRYSNANKDFNLYSPMNMMRSTIFFDGENDDYTVDATLIPFVKHDLPFDDDRMNYFIQAYSEQYDAMLPALSVLDGNSYIDFKLYNTYGRSNNYYIGPQDGLDVLWDSEILLDNVYVTIKFVMNVYDRSIYTQTSEAVISEISAFFESLDAGTEQDVHVSDLIHAIKDNHPNVHYIRFLGFNDYDANKQSIFVKYDDISELRKDELMSYVPEMIRVDRYSIEITEEV